MDVSPSRNGKEATRADQRMLAGRSRNKDGEEVEICELICEMDSSRCPPTTRYALQDGEP